MGEHTHSGALTAILAQLSLTGTTPAELPERIELCKRALAMVNRKKHPGLWGRLQKDLGYCYFNLSHTSNKSQAEKAIKHYQKALESLTPQRFPRIRAKTLMNLSQAYAIRTQGNRAENIERGIDALEEALEVLDREQFPTHWAMIQNNLSR